MRLGISQKIFAAIVLPVAASLITMSLMFQHRLEQGFLGYLNALEQQELQELSERLADLYIETGSWEFLREPPHRLPRVLGLQAGGRPPKPANRNQKPKRPGDHPAKPRRDKREKPSRGDKRQKPQSDDVELISRITILDKDHRRLLGPPARKQGVTIIPITNGDESLGQLIAGPMPAISGEQDLQFADQQRTAAQWITVLMLLLAIPISFYLSRLLVRPIRRIAGAAQKLRSGEYQTRVAMRGWDELAELGRDMDRLAKTLEENRESQKSWLADISHELRTPVSILQGEIEALRDGVRPLDDAALNSLQQETQRLKRLVDDVYQLATSDSGALNYQFKKLDLSDWLEDLLAGHSRRVREYELSLQTQIQPGIQMAADDSRLTQLIDNLCANSCRYTDAGGAIRVRLEKRQGMIRLSWEDSAPGVPEHALDKLFDRLYRVEASRSRATGGAGLGLSICSNIVAAHSGRIYAQGSSLGGLNIVVEFPDE